LHLSCTFAFSFVLYIDISNLFRFQSCSLLLQAVLAALSETSSKRRRLEADKRKTSTSEVTPPSISRAYGNHISHGCFVSVYEVAADIRSSKYPPTRAALNNAVNRLKDEVAYRALSANHLPPEPKRVKGCQLDVYVLLTGGELPPDELRFGGQDPFFKTLKNLIPDHDDTSIMWNNLIHLVQYYPDFNINAVRPIMHYLISCAMHLQQYIACFPTACAMQLTFSYPL
jgi:hypothetical protein